MGDRIKAMYITVEGMSDAGISMVSDKLGGIDEVDDYLRENRES
jgi:hypothetical protein